MSTMRRLVALLALLAACALVPPPAFAARTVRMKFPRFTVPPRSDAEYCSFVRLPMKKPFDLGGSIIVNVGVNPTFASHHFLLWAYEGNDMAAFPKDGQIVASKACLDFGPTDTNQRILIAGSQQPILKTRLPPGLAQQVKPTVSEGRSIVGLILNSHWINGSDKPQRASVKIRLTAAKKHSVRQFLLPIFDVVANGFIAVPPGQVKTESWAWRPGTKDFAGGLGGGSLPNGPACVVSLTSHMHKRGKDFLVQFVNGNTVQGPPLLDNKEYTDPQPAVFDGLNGHPPPLLVKPSQGLRYTCTHDNGITTPQKMGCEEQPGVVPGVDAATTLLSGHGTTGAAKRCTTDADCAGFGTGRCVPANLVFGYTSDDDMCIMPGAYYPANAQGSCDLSGLPTLN